MYQDSGDGRFMAETMMIKELIPHIDATYRTIADRKARCIEGFSMGGRGSTNLAMKHPQLFGSLFNQSGNVYHVSDAANLPNAYLGDDPQRLRDNDAFLNLTKNPAFSSLMRPSNASSPLERPHQKLALNSPWN